MSLTSTCGPLPPLPARPDTAADGVTLIAVTTIRRPLVFPFLVGLGDNMSVPVVGLPDEKTAVLLPREMQ